MSDFKTEQAEYVVVASTKYSRQVFLCKQMRGLDLELPIASNFSKTLMSEKKHLVTLEWQTSGTSKYIQ